MTVTSNSMRYTNWSLCSSMMLLLFLLFTRSSSSSIVESLPGFEGNLPFKLETGYVGVGEEEDVQLFYYFVESQSDPLTDPLLLWMNGGPGTSSLLGFFYGNGPLSFDYDSYGGGFPTLKLNPFTWTKFLNVIFIDQPVGTGFSYSETSQGYYTNDQLAATYVYEFLQKWLINHSDFATNSFYVGGCSYSGIIIPVVVQKIYDGNAAGHRPFMNIIGYVLSSPKADDYLDANAIVSFAHRLSFVSDELYKSAEISCNGDYVNIDPTNEQCVEDVAAINELISGINNDQVLQPMCTTGSKKPKNNTDGDQRILMKTSKNSLHSSPILPLWCKDQDYVLVGIWANYQTVREALHIREGTQGQWQLFNLTLAYIRNIPSTIEYHRNLSRTNLRALIYTADLDLHIPPIATQEWIRSLNLTVDDSWRAWFDDAQVAGYTERYKNNDFYMTYSIVKGAGHAAEEYKLKEAYAMAKRWFSYYPL